MDRMLLTSQYTTRPEGKLRNRAVKTMGRNIMIFCCVGSVAGGLIFCCRNMVMPMMMGVM